MRTEMEKYFDKKFESIDKYLTSIEGSDVDEEVMEVIRNKITMWAKLAGIATDKNATFNDIIQAAKDLGKEGVIRMAHKKTKNQFEIVDDDYVFNDNEDDIPRMKQSEIKTFEEIARFFDATVEDVT